MKAKANAYESGELKVIPAVLVYLMWGDRVLMLQRHIKEGDVHSGKCNGLGGKLDAGESPEQAAAREVKEECGLVLPSHRYQACGYVTFPLFKEKKKEDWHVYLFTAQITNEEAACIWTQGPEGRLVWTARDQVLGLNLWPGDRHFLPEVLAGRVVMGAIWYKDGAVIDHSVMAIPSGI
jgi:8-oxo-dGTP diphosphatase